MLWNVSVSVPVGVPVVQHPALSRPEEDHTLDSLDTRQHLWQRRALRAAFPLHLQSPHPRPQPARSWQTEDWDALLFQWWIHRLLHWWWVQSGRDTWSLSSYHSLWMFLLSHSNWLCRLVTGLLTSKYYFFLCVCCLLDFFFLPCQTFLLSVLQKLKGHYLNQLSCLWTHPPPLYQWIIASDMLMNFQSTKQFTTNFSSSMLSFTPIHTKTQAHTEACTKFNYSLANEHKHTLFFHYPIFPFACVGSPHSLSQPHPWWIKCYKRLYKQAANWQVVYVVKWKDPY